MTEFGNEMDFTDMVKVVLDADTSMTNKEAQIFLNKQFTSSRTQRVQEEPKQNSELCKVIREYPREFSNKLNEALSSGWEIPNGESMKVIPSTEEYVILLVKSNKKYI